MLNIRPRFLIHWTGCDISKKNPKNLSQSEMEQFVERLKCIVREGLWMKPGEESISGKENRYIKIKIPRVCFTEIRLSQVEKHAQQYGLMGIGLSRQFVLSRYGNPVFYIQNGSDGIVVENLDIIRGHISKHEVIKALEVVLGFLKNMSDPGKKILKYYDEMEWRIIHSDLLEREGWVSKSKQNKRLYLKFGANYIKIIIFPNRKTKEMAIEDSWLSSKLFNRKLPMIATIQDCKNF